MAASVGCFDYPQVLSPRSRSLDHQEDFIDWISNAWSCYCAVIVDSDYHWLYYYSRSSLILIGLTSVKTIRRYFKQAYSHTRPPNFSRSVRH